MIFRGWSAGRTPGIRVMVPALIPNDATGNDAVQMYEALHAQGHNVEIVAETVDRSCAGIARPLAAAPKRYWQSPEDILIYHHSTGWPWGERILFTSRNRAIVRYHNITPPHFFAAYSVPHVKAAEEGLDCSRRIARHGGIMLLGDSSFNCGDLIGFGAARERCRILPPLHAVDALAQAPFDIPTIRRYSGGMVNILFVGGVKPNKGHARAIQVLAAYQREYNYCSRLLFVGRIEDSFRNYVAELQRLAARMGVADSVVFTGYVTPSQMKSLYAAADVFLCTSEHEGFCVPLVEAMCFRVPVVAWATTAIPETLGGAGVLLEDWDASLFASRIAELVAQPAQAARFGELARARYMEAFTLARLRKRLCEIIGEFIASPKLAREGAGQVL